MGNLTSDAFFSKKNQARVKLCLRFLVAVYILYLTKGIIEAAIKGASIMPTWVIVLVSAVFISSSVIFCFYAWRQYKHAVMEIIKEDDKSLEEKSEANHS